VEAANIGAGRPGNGPRLRAPSRRLGEKAIEGLLALCGFLSVLTTTAIVIEISSDSSSPPAAKASVLATRKRRRLGAASSELVIVRWRHSPVMPTIARITMVTGKSHSSVNPLWAPMTL